MKKLFVIFFSLISLNGFCQDTIFINHKPNIVTIKKISDDFIYYQLPGIKDIMKIPRSSTNGYSTLLEGRVLQEAEIRSEKLNPEAIFYKDHKNTDSINYQISYIRYNLGKFHKEFITGICISSIGILTAISTPYLIKIPEDFNAYSDYSKKIKAVTLISAGISLVGTIISLDSYKWIKRASIEPTLYGVKINYKF